MVLLDGEAYYIKDKEALRAFVKEHGVKAEPDTPTPETQTTTPKRSPK
jgi:hypothetical protein